MMAAKPKGGLGKGLGSLFEESVSLSGPDSTTTLPLRDIEPDKNQPRKAFDPDSISQLAASILEHGILQPIAVRPAPAGGYRIIAGERRWRAARQAGLTEVPVVIREVTDEQAMELALIENLQREDLDPIEEAVGYQQLMERCNLTQEQAAKRLSRSRSAIANSLRLLNLPDWVVEQLKAGLLTTGHAKVLLSLDGAELQTKAAKEVIRLGLNVRQTEQLCKQMAKQPKEKKLVLRPSFPDEVQLSLEEVLGSKVKVDYKNGKGSLKVEFYSDQQLRDFARLLGQYHPEHSPEEPTK